MSDLNPKYIFSKYQEKENSLSSTIGYLNSLLENSDDRKIRVGAIHYLGLLKPDVGNVFEILENLVTSDSDELIRACAAEIIIRNYYEKGENSIKWVIENDTSIGCLMKVYASLKSVNNKNCKSLIAFMEKTLANRFSDLGIEKRELSGLGPLERKMGKVQDYLTHIDGLYYLTEEEISKILLEIRNMIKKSNIEDVQPQYAIVLKSIGKYYRYREPTDEHGEIYTEDVKKEIIAYELRLDIEPEKEITWDHLIEGYVDLREYDKAIEACKSAIKINSSFIKPYYQLARIYKILDDPIREKGALEFILENAPDDFNRWYDLGRVYNRCKEYDKAIIILERIEREKGVIFKLNELTYSYRKMKEFDKAEECIKKVLKRDPQDLTARVNLMLIEWDKGDLSSAMESHDQIMELRTNDFYGQINLLKALIKLKQFKKANELIDSIESYPSRSDFNLLVPPNIKNLISKLRDKIHKEISKNCIKVKEKNTKKK